MIASSSKTVMRSSIVPAIRRVAFSTTSTSLKQKEVHVELLREVEGLGQAYDRVVVSSGRARHELVGAGQARYIPWKRKYQRDLPRTKPTFPSPSQTSSTYSLESIPTTPLPVDIITTLPPSLTFSLRTTTPSSNTVHGSVTLADIMHKLQQEHGISEKDISLSWLEKGEGERMKELGTWDVLVKSKLEEELEAEVEIHLVRLES